MSIRHGVLAMLNSEPVHGYGLKTGIEHSTSGMLSINVGQIYTTLSRLERDGLVQAMAEDDEGRKTFRITSEGRTLLESWYATPVDRRATRDELVIKVLVAISTGDPNVQRLLDRQRAATLSELQEHTQSKRQTAAADLPRMLLLDSLILRAEAEVRWLDLCEQRLVAAEEER